MKLIGYIDERGDLVRSPNSFSLNKGQLDPRKREYLECAGMDLVFTMHAREHAELLAKIEVLKAHGTSRELARLFEDLITLVKGN